MPGAALWAVVGALSMGASARGASAEDGASTTLFGSVFDELGAPLPGVSIDFRASLAPGSRACRRIVADAEGRFDASLPIKFDCAGVEWSFPEPFYLKVFPAGGADDRAPDPAAWLQVRPGRAPIEVTLKANRASWVTRQPGCEPAPRREPVQRTEPLAPALGRACGKVRLGPRELPYGFVSLSGDTRSWAGSDPFGGGVPRPGPTVQSLVRLTKDGFCLEGVAPGNYRLQVVPPAVWPVDSRIDRLFLPLAYQGLSGAVEDYRLSFDERGRARLYDAGGKPIRENGLPDLIVARDEASANKLLEGSVRPPPAAESPSADGAPLLFAQVFGLDEPGPIKFSNTYHFAWLEGVREGGPSTAFSLPVAAGRLHALRIYSDRLALDSVRLPVHRNIASSWGKVDLRLTPASWVKGSVLLPDGKPFRPDLGGEGRRKNLVSVRAARYWDNYYTADGDYADVDGRFSLPPLRPGFYRLEVKGDGEGFDWSADPARWFWLEAGQTSTNELVLEERAEVCVDLDSEKAGLNPYPDVRPEDLVLFWMSWPRERWIVGVRPGGREEETLSGLLLSDWAPFSFLQDSRGRWIPRSRSGPGSELTSRTAPGLYDIYLIERTDKFSRPAFRVLAVEKGFRVVKGEVAKIRFAGPSFARPPETEVRGRLHYRPKVDAARLRGALSLSALHAMVVPRIDFHGVPGEYVGSAFLSLSSEQLGILIEGVEKDNPTQVAEFVDRWPYEFSMKGLRPGRYRAEIAAYGYPKKTVEIQVEEGKAAHLDVDLDVSAR